VPPLPVHSALSAFVGLSNASSLDALKHRNLIIIPYKGGTRNKTAENQNQNLF
jgi:hypothetical protein